MLEASEGEGGATGLVGLGESDKIILAAQSGHAVAIARIFCTDGSWIEANEVLARRAQLSRS